MNFYLNASGIGILLFILFIMLFSVIFALGALFLAIYLEQRLKLNETLSAITRVVFSFASFFLFLVISASVSGHYSLGEIREIYFVTNQNQHRMVVLFHQSTSKMFKHAYRLISYDFFTGKEMGRVRLTPKGYPHKRYYLLEPFQNNRIWGYNLETGFQLIDLFNARIIADEEEILRKNPALGGIFRPDWDDVLDERTNSIRVITNDGEIFTISPELVATNIQEKAKKEPAYSPSSSHKTRRKHTPVHWEFKIIGNTPYRILHAAHVSPAPDAQKMINPNLVDRWNAAYFPRNKIWVSYFPEKSRNAPLTLGYIDSTGKELKRIILNQEFKSHTKPYSMYRMGNDYYLFLGRAIGSDFYTLFALQFNPQNGEILKRIDYFR